MSFPTHARHVVIDAGIHGLPTAWRLAGRLAAAGRLHPLSNRPFPWS